ncbi:MAG: hypothetical protein N7Q72_02795, partial [Spiroplasma sp. Tabriz.8]|nr:hypothetical protein [Candidatus Regiella insecticola]MCZ8632174.1 hypothetical protein [Spiroplasma sp. Tabriz.8]
MDCLHHFSLFNAKCTNQTPTKIRVFFIYVLLLLLLLLLFYPSLSFKNSFLLKIIFFYVIFFGRAIYFIFLFLL